MCIYISFFFPVCQAELASKNFVESKIPIIQKKKKKHPIIQLSWEKKSFGNSESNRVDWVVVEGEQPSHYVPVIGIKSGSTAAGILESTVGPHSNDG